jgi:hypothetical protein
VNERFLINKFIGREMNDILINDLTDKEQMMKLMAKRGNLSRQGLDGIIFPFLRLERESATELIIAMIRFMIVNRRISKIWETRKTILIYKGLGENKPDNWRPITLTSVICRIVFGRLSQATMDYE